MRLASRSRNTTTGAGDGGRRLRASVGVFGDATLFPSNEPSSEAKTACRFLVEACVECDANVPSDQCGKRDDEKKVHDVNVM